MTSQRGFSLLELVVAIIAIGILMAVAIDRFLPFIDESERVSVLRVESQLRSILVLEAARRVARGENENLDTLIGANPVNFLAEPPKNYIGELLDADGVEPRHWYFDPERRLLVYQPGEPYSRSAVPRSDEPPSFTVRVEFADRDGDGRFHPAYDDLYGVRLARVAGTDWLETSRQ